MNTELLCPYCAGKPHLSVEMIGPLPWYVYCTKCKAQGASESSKVAAWDAWNRRFVCPDKNGKKVFAGHKVRYQPKDWKQLFRDCEVLEQRPPRYGYGLAGKDDWWTDTFYPEDIEVIESDGE